jgi:hypothetical protein
MRRQPLLIVSALLLAAACTESVTPPSAWTVPTSQRYQLTPAGTLDAEITALINALFGPAPRAKATARWTTIKSNVAIGHSTLARGQLAELVGLIKRFHQAEILPPPNHESVSTALARLILYMSLYVYDGPDTPVPPSLGTGADATVDVVKPTAPALLQTPLKHAAANFDIASVAQNTIVVISQNTSFYESKCSGPFTTKYCQYPLFYHYESFPRQRFQKLVHIAVCHVHTGNSYGPLPGVDHDLFERIHDKPADPVNYTPGGFPVPDEGIEVLPRNPGSDPTSPIVECHGTSYPQVALFNVPVAPSGVLGRALAVSARAANRAAQFFARIVTPKSAYAIDNGEEHNTLLFSTFANADTIGRPDLQVTQSALSSTTVVAGSAVTLTFTVVNGGTAPSPVVNSEFRLTPTGSTPGGPIGLMPLPAAPWHGPLFPEDNHADAVTVILPNNLAGGTYTLGPVVRTAGGLPERPGTLADNERPVVLTVQPSAPRP